jgi:uncharacterized protein YkwD
VEGRHVGHQVSRCEPRARQSFAASKSSQRSRRLSRPWLILVCITVAVTVMVVSYTADQLGQDRQLAQTSGHSLDRQLARNATRSPTQAAAQSEFAAINNLRKQHELPPLRFSASAARLAQQHSLDMATEQKPLVDRCLSCIDFQMGWEHGKEIIGSGQTIQAVTRQLLESPAHRASLLCGCVTSGGIGVVQAHGRLWVTELLFRPGPPILFGARVKPRSSDPVVTGNPEEDAVLHLESEIGRKLAIDHFYLHLGDLWPDARFSWDRRGGRVPFVDWDLEDPMYTWGQIAAGKADRIIDARAKEAAAYEGPILLAFDHEPEDHAAAYGTHTQFVAAWRHVVDIFRRAGATNVKFVLILGAAVFQEGAAALWYPGRSYVDYVGADGYNWYGAHHPARWRTVADIFTSFYYWAVDEHLPAMITEAGCLEDPNDPGRKAAWFREATSWLRTHPDIKAFVYFDTDQRWPWWVDTSPQSLEAYRAMGQNSLFR